MLDGRFMFRDDLLKHHVRVNGWLPRCKERRDKIQAAPRAKDRRRLRYFTFCAVDAIDVLMLEVARVITASPKTGKFDTVFFFDRKPEFVLETQRRVPGAIGFAGNFSSVVLLDDADDELIVEAVPDDRLPEELADVARTRSALKRINEHRRFLQSFPFDVINLDLEEFLFRPSDPLPGRLINAFRKVFHWQHRPLGTHQLDGFSLMFTTQIGPPNMSADYLDMLRGYLESNLNRDPTLAALVLERTGFNDMVAFQNANFAGFFKLGMPKTLLTLLMEEDWCIDAEQGIVVYEFARPSGSGPYSILHLVMDVFAQDPSQNHRPPGSYSPTAQAAYNIIARKLVIEQGTVVTDETIDRSALQASLDEIIAHGRLYFSEEDPAN